MLYLDTLWAFAQKVPHLCKCIVKDTKRDYVSIAMKKTFFYVLLSLLFIFDEIILYYKNNFDNIKIIHIQR